MAQKGKFSANDVTTVNGKPIGQFTAADVTGEQWHPANPEPDGVYEELQQSLQRNQDDGAVTGAAKGVGRGLLGLIHSPVDIAHTAFDPIDPAKGEVPDSGQRFVQRLFVNPAVDQGVQAVNSAKEATTPG